MKRILSILTLFSLFFLYSSTFAQSVDELVTYQPLENTFIICLENSTTTREVENGTSTPETPNCIVWSPTNSSTTEPENIDGIQVIGFLNARYYNSNDDKFISQDPVFWELGITKDGKAVLTNPQSLNSYSYGNDNPIANSDKGGRLSKDALYSNPISSLVDVIGWGSVSAGIRIAGLPFSATLLSHSASYNPKDVAIDSSNQGSYGNVVDKIKETNPYKDFINVALQNAEKGVMDTQGSISFNKDDNADLYYSLHLVNINTKVEKGKDGWVVNSQVSDKYDFNATNPQTYKGTLTRLPATQAYKDQGKGYLSNFTTNISINDKSLYEKK